MNYLSFCDEISSVLSHQLRKGTSISKETIRKNNGVMLDALVIHTPNSASAPIIYLKPLYHHYTHGSSMEGICRMILSSLETDSVVSEDMLRYLNDPNSASDRIACRLISRDANKELLKNIPWIPFLDLAVIFYLYFGEPNETLITSIIHNRQAEIWGLSTNELFSVALKNTQKFFPHTITPLSHMLLSCMPSNMDVDEFPDVLPDLHVLTNKSGIHGASCLLYEDILKDFADQTGTDFIILPSSIHEVLLFPDHHDRDYADLCHMVWSINRSDVPAEDILSDHIYLFRRFKEPHLIVYSGDSHTADTDGRENP